MSRAVHYRMNMSGAEKITTEAASKLSAEELYTNLDSSSRGLSSSEAKKRRDRYGANEIVEKKTSALRKFLGFFWGPIPWMIEMAAILSGAVMDWEDFNLIVALLLLNAGVGFWQEQKADDAIELLKERLAPGARVLRDGSWRDLQAATLVPGDMVRIRLGDIVPADVMLVDGQYLEADESALTGESLPVEKHVGSVAYSGSVIKKGEMTALVVTTGMRTFFGKTASLVEETRARSHFQRAVLKISYYLISIAAVLVALIFVVALFRHESVIETLRFVLVLTVASIPVALPAVLSVTMAVGAVALTRKDAIVSRLASIEEMAGMDVLCADKTGTLTENRLTVADAVPLPGFSEADILLFGALASREEDKDPIDDAILKAAGSLNAYRVIEFRPFDPVTKRTEAELEASDGTRFKVSKGAPQAVLSLVAERSQIEQQINNTVDEMAGHGYRALGVARTDKNGGWNYVGLIPLYDPPRDDSLSTITTAGQMGVTVKMVTGDHVAIAREIATRVGLEPNILPAREILDKTDHETRDMVERADGFAQVFPEHKYHIVELLQERGHITGMTGDGVNDAPALKKADAGIAVAGSTDAAKSAADIVFTKPGISVIIDAIKQSRRIFERMTSYSIYRIAETMRVLLFMTLSILIFSYYPVTPLMIVLIALLNDAPIMMIAYDKTRLQQTPVRWDMRKVLAIATVLGVAGVFASFFLFYLGQNVLGLDRDTLQTLIFLKLMVGGHMTIYLARTGGRHAWTRPYPAPALYLATESTQVIATVLAVYGVLMSPLGWRLALLVWGYALAAAVVTDFIKVYFYKLIALEAFFHRQPGMGESTPG